LNEGTVEGAVEGDALGITVGTVEGTVECDALGITVGIADGEGVGLNEGTSVGE
jgi:hypothetical protein